MNILCTSVGRRSYMIQYFKQALGEKGKVHAANSSAFNPSFALADYTVLTPLVSSEKYIPFLLSYCQKHQIKAIISFFDLDCEVLALHQVKFEAIGVRLLISSYEVVRTCNDKLATYAFCLKHQFKTPLTYDSLDCLKKAIATQEVYFPIIIKPRVGMGSLGIYEVDNMEECEMFYHKSKQAIVKQYAEVTKAFPLTQQPIFQEKVIGQEYGLDIINDLAGNYVNTLVKVKFAMRSGSTDIAQTMFHPELAALGQKIGQALGHIGCLDVDIIQCNDQWVIIDCNARFGGGYPFSHFSGANVVQALICWLDNQKGDHYCTIQHEMMIMKDMHLVVLEKMED